MKYLEPELISLPFDQYQRYRLVAEVLDRLRPSEEAVEILEVGGYPGVGKRFFLKDEFFIVDLFAEGKADEVVASALSLPFPDDSFPVVISVDLLEHLLPEQREQAISEMARVSAELILLSAPFQYSLARQTEKLVFEFIKDWLGWEHKYLKEHLEIPAPKLVETESELVKLGFDTQILPNGNLERWLIMMLGYYYLEGLADALELRQRLSQFYNQHFFFWDISEPAYRHLIVASRCWLKEKPQALEDLISKIQREPEPDYQRFQLWLEFFRHGEIRRFEEKISQLEQALKSREEEIAHLRAYISELEDFHQKVKSSLLYRLYQAVFKRKK